MQQVLLPHAGRSCQGADPKFYSGISALSPADRYILFRDDYNNRKGIPALPFSRRKAVVENPAEYQKIIPQTIGEHIKKRRLQLGLSQKELAGCLKVATDTITYWENGRCKPLAHQFPRILEFLKYYPFEENGTIGEQIKKYRLNHGLSIKDAAKRLKVDPGTLSRWESGKTKPYAKAFRQLVSKLPSYNT